MLALGRYDMRSGVGFAVFLGLTEQGAPFIFADLAPVFRTPGPKAVLVPHASAIDSDLSSRLAEAEARVFLLDDVVVWDQKTTLAARFDPGTIFRDLIAKLPGSGDDAPAPPAIALPPGTTWSSIRIAFENDELFNFSGPGVQRAVAPADVGMADKRTPDMIEAILDGTQQPEVTLAQVLEPFPLAWAEQAGRLDQLVEARFLSAAIIRRD
jgi:hypothetical protein